MSPRKSTTRVPSLSERFDARRPGLRSDDRGGDANTSSEGETREQRGASPPRVTASPDISATTAEPEERRVSDSSAIEREVRENRGASERRGTADPDSNATIAVPVAPPQSEGAKDIRASAKAGGSALPPGLEEARERRLADREQRRTEEASREQYLAQHREELKEEFRRQREEARLRYKEKHLAELAEQKREEASRDVFQPIPSHLSKWRRELKKLAAAHRQREREAAAKSEALRRRWEEHPEECRRELLRIYGEINEIHAKRCREQRIADQKLVIEEERRLVAELAAKEKREFMRREMDRLHRESEAAETRRIAAERSAKINALKEEWRQEVLRVYGEQERLQTEIRRDAERLAHGWGRLAVAGNTRARGLVVKSEDFAFERPPNNDASPTSDAGPHDSFEPPHANTPHDTSPEVQNSAPPPERKEDPLRPTTRRVYVTRAEIDAQRAEQEREEAARRRAVNAKPPGEAPIQAPAVRPTPSVKSGAGRALIRSLDPRRPGEAASPVTTTRPLTQGRGPNLEAIQRNGQATATTSRPPNTRHPAAAGSVEPNLLHLHLQKKREDRKKVYYHRESGEYRPRTDSRRRKAARSKEQQDKRDEPRR